MQTRSTRIRRHALCGFGMAVASFICTGCQIDVGGQTLPSPYYLSDDIQYFPAGPEFKLSQEAAAMKEYQAREELEDSF